VTDAALMLGVLCGHDPLDSTSANVPVPDFPVTCRGEVRGLRFGVPREYFVAGMDPEVEAAVRAAVRVFEGLGAVPVELSLPHTQYVVPAYYLIATAEASSNLARYDGVKYGYRARGPFANLREMYTKTRAEGFGSEVKRRIMLGTYALSSGYYDAYYLKALRVRTLLRRDFEQAFEKVDVIASPVAPTTAFRLGEKIDDPLAMYLGDVYTTSVNLAGIPGISIPCGFDAAGLPIGFQLMGPPFGEETLLAAAHQYQLVTDHHVRSPLG